VSSNATDVEIIDVRPHHRIDDDALAAYMAENVEGFAGPLTVRQFQGGMSNPTYILETPSRRYVMRKKPPGELLKSAHQVDREYKVMAALKGTDVAVPKVYCAVRGRIDVIGQAFYIMEFVLDRVVLDP